jgi:hypothetical protein
MEPNLTPDIYDSVPRPAAIRCRLAYLLRERDVLRALLRVAELKERDTPQRVGGEPSREVSRAI